MSPLDEEILSMLRFVSERAILPRFRNLASCDIVEKAEDDLVTIADREAEAFLTEALSKLAPDVPVVGEEAVHADSSLLDRLSGACWIVDPIDGTHNYALGKPPFGTMIALADGGQAVAGWIYDPLARRFCHAKRGEGAFVNGDRITARPSVGDRPVAAVSTLFMTDEQRETVERKIAPHYTLVDIPRCAAEQYPRLALGENDVSSFKRTFAWDHAAGVLWLNEAGGKAARLDGTAYRVNETERSGLVGASSPAIWDAFVERVLAD